MKSENEIKRLLLAHFQQEGEDRKSDSTSADLSNEYGVRAYVAREIDRRFKSRDKAKPPTTPVATASPVELVSNVAVCRDPRVEDAFSYSLGFAGERQSIVELDFDDNDASGLWHSDYRGDVWLNVQHEALAAGTLLELAFVYADDRGEHVAMRRLALLRKNDSGSRTTDVSIPEAPPADSALRIREVAASELSMADEPDLRSAVENTLQCDREVAAWRQWVRQSRVEPDVDPDVIALIELLLEREITPDAASSTSNESEHHFEACECPMAASDGRDVVDARFEWTDAWEPLLPAAPGGFAAAGGRQQLALWDWLHLVSTGERTNERYLKEMWQTLTRNGTILEQCREMYDGRDLRALKDAWKDATNRDLVSRFLSSYYYDPKYVGQQRVNDSIHYHALLGLIAATISQAASGTESNDWRVKSIQELEHSAGSGSGPFRDIVGYLTRRTRAPNRSRVVPVLGYKNDRGFVSWLHLELIQKGSGEFYRDPLTMAFTPMTDEFLRSINLAWRESEDSRLITKKNSPMIDVRWHLAETVLPALDGPSLSAAMTVAAITLLNNKRRDRSRSVAVVAEVTRNGGIRSVGGIGAKVRAAFERGDMVGIVVHPDNMAEAKAAAEAVAPGKGENVLSAHSVEEVLRLLRPEPRPRWLVALAAVLIVVFVPLGALAGWSFLLERGSPKNDVVISSETEQLSPEPSTLSEFHPSMEPVGKPIPRNWLEQGIVPISQSLGTGLAGDIGDITLGDSDEGNLLIKGLLAGKGPQKHRHMYTDDDGDGRYELNANPARHVMVYWLDPKDNFGESPNCGYDLRELGLFQVKWEARGDLGDLKVQFLFGGVSHGWRSDEDAGWKWLPQPYPDSAREVQLSKPEALTDQWKEFESDVIDLPEDELRRVVGLFCLVVKWPSLSPGAKAPGSAFEIEIKNVRYEKVTRE